MLYCIVTFDEKWGNLPTLVIFYKVGRCTKHILTRYENVDIPKKLNEKISYSFYIFKNSTPKCF